MIGMQDTGKFRTNEKDKFFTKPSVATLCVEALRPHAVGTWIEPSAGAGAFVDAATCAVVALDIEPDRADIRQQDFLAWNCPHQHCTVFGNPPFGRQSTLARKFIRHAATFADVIAFILPRSFTKPSMQKAFPLEFHLMSETHLETDAFVVNGQPYSVPCVFQVWKRMQTPRVIADEVNGTWTYVKKSEEYDVAIRRVGGQAGRCMRPDASLSVQSHYFVKLPQGCVIDVVLNHLNAHVFPSNTTGPRSLSKAEINTVLAECVAESLAPA
jgi:hypothetical protein